MEKPRTSIDDPLVLKLEASQLLQAFIRLYEQRVVMAFHTLSSLSSLDDLTYRQASSVRIELDNARKFFIAAIIDEIQNHSTSPGAGHIPKESRDINEAFHRLWTKAVGQDGYRKLDWLELSRLLSERGITV